MDDNLVKKKKPNKKHVMPTRTLHHYFTKGGSEAKKMEEDDIIFVQEVKSSSEEPDWAVKNLAAARRANGCDAMDMKPNYLKDVHQTKCSSTNQQSVSANSKTSVGNLDKTIRESNFRASNARSEPASSQCKENSNAVVQLEPFEEKSLIQSKPSIGICTQKEAISSCNHPLSPDKTPKDLQVVGDAATSGASGLRLWNGVVDSSVVENDLTEFLNSMSEKVGEETKAETSMALERLSLKMLDSQSTDFALSNDEEEEPQSPVMELDVDLLESTLPAQGVSIGKENGNVYASPIRINSATVTLSDDPESEQDIFNPRKPNGVGRRKVTKRLFPAQRTFPAEKALSAITVGPHHSPTSTKTLGKFRSSCKNLVAEDEKKSPVAITTSTRSNKSPTDKFKSFREGHKVNTKSSLKDSGKSVPCSSTPKPKRLVFPPMSNIDKVRKKSPKKTIGKVKKKSPKKREETGNVDVCVISSDSELEDVMSLLNHSNTFSPTKRAVENSHQLSDDDDLEETMLSLNSINTYSPTKRKNQYIPYYLGNVRLAISGVMTSPFDVHYFNVEDVMVLETFERCQVQAQMLYLRMLFRQFNWIPRAKLVYEEIPDVSEALSELVNRQLVMCNDGELSLKEQLEMLSAPALKKVCKDMKLRNDFPKPLLIEFMLMHSQQRTAANMFNKKHTVERAMISRVKKELPPCYKLTETARDVFMRVFLLYSLVFHIHSNGSKESTQSELMYAMLRETIGQVRFPVVPANRQTKIFIDRMHVIRKQKGLDLEEKLDNCLQKKTFSLGQPLVEKCKQLYVNGMEDTQLVEFDKQLPAHLRRYTCTNQMLRCLNLAAELLQKLKEWQEAASLFELMLKQRTYSLNQRGYWYDRLSLIYHFHIKDLGKAAKVIAEAFNDSCVRVGHKLSLYQRANRLLSTKAFKSAAVLVGVSHHPIIDAPKTEITGIGHSGALPGSDRTNVFLNADGQGVRACSVESVAMEHYMTKYELNRGLHRESSVFTTLFGLLFWDIVYLPGIPDTFFNIYQYQPLDFQTDSFYERRKHKIDERLQEINVASVEDLRHLVEPVWTEHNQECSVCVIWDVFESAQDAVDLMSCLGPPLLAEICKRFAQDYRFCRSGMPDLTMWNATTGQYKIVEVKGPNDKLSPKQILWLDFLIRKGANAEVCYVRLDSKRYRRSCN